MSDSETYIFSYGCHVAALFLHSCKAQTYLDDFFVISGLLSTTAFSTVRIWAIWGRAPLPALAVFLTGAIVPAVNIVSDFWLLGAGVEHKAYVRRMRRLPTNWPASIMYDDLSSLTHLLYSRKFCHVVPLITRSLAVTSDLLVLILTWVKTIGIWRSGVENEGEKPALITLVLRDGTTYFLALLTMNVITLALDATQTDQGGSTSFVVVMDAVTANLIARFILDLRTVYHKDPNPGNGSRAMSTIQFGARSLVGNMGAPLSLDESTWASSPADDVTGGHTEIYEEALDPLRAGLGLDREETRESKV
ncbi:hypothetical protein EIP91_004775 [Steccherinum ochraceum]|uniref:Uncharacterized protein n=1 Tax=Steccherinum ochraceum TaxID=92696 RepID=A0A4R0RJH1_9APHY|nr:hypothetical protein EIP91_004775 [Steccherinum ochraceum]